MSMTHDEMIAVIQAAKEGKTIQIKGNISGEWNDASGCRFNFVQCQYRIKPEPLVLWVVYRGKCLHLSSDNEIHAKRYLESQKGVTGYTLKKFVEVTE